MYFDSWQAVWAMDGHGAFVWASLVVALVVLGALLIWPCLRQRRLQRQAYLRHLREGAVVRAGAG